MPAPPNFARSAGMRSRKSTPTRSTGTKPTPDPQSIKNYFFVVDVGMLLPTWSLSFSLLCEGTPWRHLSADREPFCHGPTETLLSFYPTRWRDKGAARRPTHDARTTLQYSFPHPLPFLPLPLPNFYPCLKSQWRQVGRRAGGGLNNNFFTPLSFIDNLAKTVNKLENDVSLTRHRGHWRLQATAATTTRKGGGRENER